MRLFFYSLTVHRHSDSVGGFSVSASLQLEVHYFSTQRKLDLWQSKNITAPDTAEFAMHEITVQCCRELIKLSKKKVKHKCEECGRPSPNPGR